MPTTSRLEAFNQARNALEKARRESDRLRVEAIRELLEERKPSRLGPAAPRVRRAAAQARTESTDDQR